MAARYEYDPYGQILRLSSVAGPGGILGIGYENSFRFSTKRTDPTSDLVHYEYRVYSPALGRWLNRDPLGELGGLNLHGFLGNDGLNDVDALGESPLSKALSCLAKRFAKSQLKKQWKQRLKHELGDNIKEGFKDKLDDEIDKAIDKAFNNGLGMDAAECCPVAGDILSAVNFIMDLKEAKDLLRDLKGKLAAKNPLNGGNRIDPSKISAPPPARGKAPIGTDGKPVELHHTDQAAGNASPLDEMTRTEH